LETKRERARGLPLAREIKTPVSTLSPPRPVTVRSATAEQFAPVLRVHADVLLDCAPSVNPSAAQRRIANGQVAYDALAVLRSCGDLLPRFVRMLGAFEVAGFVSNVERRALLDSELDVDELVAGWFTGDRMPRDLRRRVAWQAASVIGNALLRAATERVGAPSLWKHWTRVVCPCCGGSPDIVLLERGTQRTLVCARCDAQWRSPRSGCLGCEREESPAIARIANRELGYVLMMCSACGRFLKERPRRGMESLIVERAITTELELAAEQRGLRI
jgi:formate dehydrogenase maturation protein FdhE